MGFNLFIWKINFHHWCLYNQSKKCKCGTKKDRKTGCGGNVNILKTIDAVKVDKKKKILLNTPWCFYHCLCYIYNKQHLCRAVTYRYLLPIHHKALNIKKKEQD